MENPNKMDDLGGKTHYSRKHPNLPYMDPTGVGIYHQDPGVLRCLAARRTKQRTDMPWKTSCQRAPLKTHLRRLFPPCHSEVDSCKWSINNYSVLLCIYFIGICVSLVSKGGFTDLFWFTHIGSTLVYSLSGSFPQRFAKEFATISLPCICLRGAFDNLETN